MRDPLTARAEQEHLDPLAQYVYWVGVDTDGDDLDRIFNSILDAEQVDDAAVTRMVLSKPDPRGDRGPRFLASFALDDGAKAEEFIARRRAASSSWVQPRFAELQPRWRVGFRKILDVGEPEPVPTPIQLIGMTPAHGAPQRSLDEFNNFYDRIHVSEVLKDWSWKRGVRYELDAELQHPAPGCPRYLAIYEICEGSLPVALSEQPEYQGPPIYTAGPSAWLGRDVPWRLRYVPV